MSHERSKSKGINIPIIKTCFFLYDLTVLRSIASKSICEMAQQIESFRAKYMLVSGCYDIVCPSKCGESPCAEKIGTDSFGVFLEAGLRNDAKRIYAPLMFDL